jgi:glycerophosphoryl diester phosphodiesterase
MSAMRRVGHKGADLISPGNTFASFAAALEAGVDMIEFDVLSEHPDGTGELLLAHDFHDAAGRTPHTLEEGLAHFAADAYAGIELDVDLKLGGYEERVLDALRRHDLLGRTLISTMEESSLTVLRERCPEARIGWSVPRLRRDPLRNPLTVVPAVAMLTAVRALLPSAAAGRMRRGEIDALMCHWRLVTPALSRAISGAGGELYVWTVDDAARIAHLERIGVTGVITNDPRLFTALDPA